MARTLTSTLTAVFADGACAQQVRLRCQLCPLLLGQRIKARATLNIGP